MRPKILLPFTVFFSVLPVSAEVYSHEFVMPDGGSLICTVTVQGSAGSSKCQRLSPESRQRYLETRNLLLSRLNDCADLAMASRFSNPDPAYSSAVLQTCLGRDPYSSKRPSGLGMAYIISCDGVMTNRVTSLLNPPRKLTDCPRLPELALSGKLPYRP